MLVTEKQAKGSMWCPMARVRWQGGPVTFNRGNSGPKARLYNICTGRFFSVCTPCSGANSYDAMARDA
jgi:hypothetical protein